MKKNKKREEIQKIATTKIVENRFNGLLVVSPRVGKCKITIDALNTVEKQINVLILAPKIPILDSWKEEIKKWKLKDSIVVDFCWSNSLKKVKSYYNLIICDEFHDYNNKVLAHLRMHQMKNTRILGLTGTSTEYVEFIWNNVLSLTPFYEYPFSQAIKDKIVADYEINCIGCTLDNTDKYISAGSLDKPFYQTELAAYNYWNNLFEGDKERGVFKSLQFYASKRTDIIYNSRTKLQKTLELVDAEERCLIFTGRQNIADQIGDDSFHSKSKKSLNAFVNEKINKLSVIGMVSMGITIPNLKSIIFNQLKSVDTLAIQQAMRAMNLEGGEKAKIQIVYLKNTQDEVWLKSALQGFEQEKIKYY